jgi:hypothetical protein
MRLSLVVPFALLFAGCGGEELPPPPSAADADDGAAADGDVGGSDEGSADDDSGDDGSGDDGSGDDGSGDDGSADDGSGDGSGDGGDDTAEPDDTGEGEEEAPPPVPVLGNGGHTLAHVVLQELANADHELSVPRDLEFNPEVPGELWVVNREDDSATLFWDLGTDKQRHQHFASFGNEHWLAQPTAIAFGDPGMVATAHESDGDVPDGQDPTQWMGPTLWPTDLEIFDGGQMGHLDMVHDSAFMGGIAWQEYNTYWVHDGYSQTLVSYAFNEPHEPGGTDHFDAQMHHYAQGEVGYVEDTPAHLVYDHETALLYFADPYHNRVGVLDTTTGTVTDGDDGREASFEVVDAAVSTLIDGEAFGLSRPSGLERHDGLFFVTDNALGLVLAFDADGALVDWLDTELPAGALGGMTFDDEGRLYLVDGESDRLLRISPLE